VKDPQLQSASLLSPRGWAECMFGSVKLQDRRREQRLVALAALLGRRPSASLPEQMHSPQALKAAYRLLASEAVSFSALATPHWEATRRQAGTPGVVLLIQDTTELDYTHHPTTQGLGPIGNGRGRGFLLQSVLAVRPAPRQVLGLAAQEPFLRQPAPQPNESRAQRQQRARESQVWSRQVVAIGTPPPGATWVHVGDRYSDMFEFFTTCRQQACQFLIRAAQDRRVRDGTASRSLFALARTLPSQAERPLSVTARPGRPAREARVHLSFSAVTVLPPTKGPWREPVPLWVVRVWEPEPPPETEPVEWILLTTVPTTSVAAGWERVDWYTQRWLAEDYHQCLKTGCAMEQRQLQTYAGLTRLLGLLGPLAAHLLELRELARREPERLAPEALPGELVRVVAALAEVPVATLTLAGFWRSVAQQGGYLGRRRDGPPGWQTLWRGWLYIQTLLEGIHLARHLPP